MDGDVDENLISLPKGLKVWSLDGGVKVIDRPHEGKKKLPKTVRTYDRFNKGFSIFYNLFVVESPPVPLSDPSTSTSKSLSSSSEGELVDGTC